MRLLLLLLIVLGSLHSVAQHKKTRDTTPQLPQVDLEKLTRQIDSSNKMLETLGNAQFKQIQDAEFKRSMEQMSHNMDGFMAAQRERERQQKKQMWIRLGLGVLIGAFGIFAMLRRRKKAKQ